MPVPPAFIAEHRWLAQDNLNDCISNVAYYLQNSAAVGSQNRYLPAASLPIAIAATETLVAAMPLTIPFTFEGNTYPGTVKVGSIIRFTFAGTYTSAGGQTVTFTLRMGTLGTTSDTSCSTVSVTSAGSGSAIAFTGQVQWTITALGAGTGAGVGNLWLLNQQATSNATASTGISVFAVNEAATSAISVAPTTTATFADLTMLAGASNSASITQVIGEVIN
jgi:hypothetical protein